MSCDMRQVEMVAKDEAHAHMHSLTSTDIHCNTHTCPHIHSLTYTYTLALTHGPTHFTRSLPSELSKYLQNLIATEFFSLLSDQRGERSRSV